MKFFPFACFMLLTEEQARPPITTPLSILWASFPGAYNSGAYDSAASLLSSVLHRRYFNETHGSKTASLKRSIPSPCRNLSLTPRLQEKVRHPHCCKSTTNPQKFAFLYPLTSPVLFLGEGISIFSLENHVACLYLILSSNASESNTMVCGKVSVFFIGDSGLPLK